MRIAVAGATGVVGRHVVAVAEERGHDVARLARATGVDVRSGAGLEAALAGAGAVVDVLSTPTQRRGAAEAFFGETTRRLLAAGRAAGVGHHVALSIVGIDEVATGYYRGKQRQERELAEQPDATAVPWSLLRATQFHEFAEQSLGFAALGPVSLVPRMLSQPVAAREVAEALVDLAEAGPCGRVPDLAGPERLRVDAMAREVVRARGLRRRVVGVRLPGEAGRRMASGALCPTADGPRGRTTFAAWLAAR